MNLKAIILSCLLFRYVSYSNPIIYNVIKRRQETSSTSYKLRPSDIELYPIEIKFKDRYKFCVINEFDEKVYVLNRVFTYNPLFGSITFKMGLIDNKYLYIDSNDDKFLYTSIKFKGSKHSYNVSSYDGYNGRNGASGRYITEIHKDDINMILNNSELEIIVLSRYSSRTSTKKIRLYKGVGYETSR